MARSKWLVTSGQCSCMLITCMTQKIHGMGSCTMVYWYPWVLWLLSNWHCGDYSLVGVQAHLHLAKFSWPRAQSNVIWECMYSRHVCCHQSFTGLWLMLRHRCVSLFTYIVPLICADTGPVFTHVCSSFLSDRSCHWFWVVLQQHPRSLGWPWWVGWSWSVVNLVESVGQFGCLGILAES